MMSKSRPVDDHQVPEFNYHLLRNALNRFSKNLQQLESVEYDKVVDSANKSFELETLVLESDEARSFVVPAEQVDAALQEISARYPSQEEFVEDMKNNGLNEDTLRTALYRELTFDGVMQLVGARTVDITDLDIRLFYEMHHDRFSTPETRLGSHILVTVNEDFSENTEMAAKSTIEQVHQKLNGRGNRFGQFAKRHSECPTAMDAGKLGEISRGQLYPELDEALFSMEEAQISQPIRTELGYHILFCEKIKPARRVPLTQAADRIRQLLQERNQRNCQKNWLKELQESRLKVSE